MKFNSQLCSESQIRDSLIVLKLPHGIYFPLLTNIVFVHIRIGCAISVQKSVDASIFVHRQIACRHSVNRLHSVVLGAITSTGVVLTNVLKPLKSAVTAKRLS